MQPHDEWHPQRDPMAPRNDDPDDGRVILGALIAVLIMMGAVLFWPRGQNATETAMRDDLAKVDRPSKSPTAHPGPAPAPGAASNPATAPTPSPGSPNLSNNRDYHSNLQPLLMGGFSLSTLRYPCPRAKKSGAPMDTAVLAGETLVLVGAALDPEVPRTELGSLHGGHRYCR